MASIKQPINIDNVYIRPTNEQRTDESVKLDALLDIETNAGEYNDVKNILKGKKGIHTEDSDEDNDILEDSDIDLTPIERLKLLSLLAYRQLKRELSGMAVDSKMSSMIKAHSDLIKAIQDIKEQEKAHSESLGSLLPYILAQPVYEKLYTKVQSKLEILPARLSSMLAFKDAKFIRERMDTEIASVFADFRRDLGEVIQGLKQAQLNLVTSNMDVHSSLDDEGKEKPGMTI